MSEASEASGFEANESEASETRTKPKRELSGWKTMHWVEDHAFSVGISMQLCVLNDDLRRRRGLGRHDQSSFHSEEIDLPLIRKECTLCKLNTAWKQKKYKLRKVYDMYPIDAERKRNGPKKVKKEEWEAFVDMCSTEEDKFKRCNGKLARENMKNPHTTGRMGVAPVIEQLKKDSPTGEVSRTQGYVATHTRRDGSFINTEMRQSLEEINRLVSVELDIVERDLDNDPVEMVIGRDGRGCVRGLGGGVTKTVYHASAPSKEIAQREKRARESSESGYEAIMARLDEANKARKILEDEVADLKRQSSGLGNASQEEVDGVSPSSLALIMLDGRQRTGLCLVSMPSFLDAKSHDIFT
ncbi:hypothetical protein IFM89_007591 [Coptis chinensis]|uniref:Transposase n=1 Tax=Coptis chinensis TaxID=261450 RepID=A0A835LBB5_9MAGN|nr:hypothetical protein IFM89_007591 [Coptis chinensis]